MVRVCSYCCSVGPGGPVSVSEPRTHLPPKMSLGFRQDSGRIPPQSAEERGSEALKAAADGDADHLCKAFLDDTSLPRWTYFAFALVDCPKSGKTTCYQGICTSTSRNAQTVGPEVERLWRPFERLLKTRDHGPLT